MAAEGSQNFAFYCLNMAIFSDACGGKSLGGGTVLHKLFAWAGGSLFWPSEGVFPPLSPPCPPMPIRLKGPCTVQGKIYCVMSQLHRWQEQREKLKVAIRKKKAIIFYLKRWPLFQRTRSPVDDPVEVVVERIKVVNHSPPLRGGGQVTQGKVCLAALDHPNLRHSISQLV